MIDPRKLMGGVFGPPAPAPAEKAGPREHPEGCLCPWCDMSRNLQHLAEPHGPLGRIEDALHQLVKLQRAEEERPDIDRALTLTTTNPQRIDRNGRRHCVLFVPGSATISVTLELPAAGVATLTLSAGPNKLMVSDGAYIALASGPAVNCLYRTTDFDPTGSV